MLSLLVYPLSQALLLGILALSLWLLGWSRAGVIALAMALAWLYLCSTALVADGLMASLERDYPPRALSATPEAEAIVLLGGATRGDTHMSTLGDLNQQADRLVHAVALYKAGRAPVVLLSGGGQPGGRAEAEVIRELEFESRLQTEQELEIEPFDLDAIREEGDDPFDLDAEGVRAIETTIRAIEER